MILERFCYGPFGTFGRLLIGDLELWTVERPWKDNEPSVSCIPEGEYTLEPHSSSKFPDTWALVGETVSHYPEPGKTRSAILIHVGNTMQDVIGCIAPGERLNENVWGVVASKRAMDQLRKEIYVTQTHTLTITHYQP